MSAERLAKAQRLEDYRELRGERGLNLTAHATRDLSGVP
jgi:hypothetical protein